MNNTYKLSKNMQKAILEELKKSKIEYVINEDKNDGFSVLLPGAEPILEWIFDYVDITGKSENDIIDELIHKYSFKAKIVCIKYTIVTDDLRVFELIKEKLANIGLNCNLSSMYISQNCSDRKIAELIDSV